jgi:hypothetical protein
VEPLAELVLFKGVAEGLVQLLLVELVDLKEEAPDGLISQFFRGLLLEDSQELHFGDGVEGVDGVLSRQVVDGVDLPQVLAALLEELFV